MNAEREHREERELQSCTVSIVFEGRHVIAILHVCIVSDRDATTSQLSKGT